MISKRDAALAILMALVVWFFSFTNQATAQANQQALQKRDAEIQKIQRQVESTDTQLRDAQQTIDSEHETILSLQKQVKANAQHLSARSGGITIPGFSPGPWGTFEATWYDDGGGINGTGITATGHKVHDGIVAVDPRIIPLGSIIEIEYADGRTSGPLLADDTGGAIKGNRIDIFTSSPAEAFKNGRQAVQVRILTRGR